MQFLTDFTDASKLSQRVSHAFWSFVATAFFPFVLSWTVLTLPSILMKVTIFFFVCSSLSGDEECNGAHLSLESACGVPDCAKTCEHVVKTRSCIAYLFSDFNA